MKSILLIDHGSRLREANDMLDCMAQLVQALVGDGVVVRHAHMELAAPTIADGFNACVEAGATEVIAFPYMLSPGRHSTSDIPQLVADAAAAHPSVEWRVTTAFGVHEKLAEVILLRAGIAQMHQLTGPDACRCWHSSGSANPGAACGAACRARDEAAVSSQRAEVARR